jgi:hypothetical protein
LARAGAFVMIGDRVGVLVEREVAGVAIASAVGTNCFKKRSVQQLEK